MLIKQQVVWSRRAHSIFSLRLFNDGVAMLFAYSSVALGVADYWTWSCVLFSLGVSIKMNVLLMAPGLAVCLVQAKGLFGAAWRALLCFAIQIALAAPFLAVNWQGYLKRSFDLGRVFLHEWTVNFKFLDEPTFQSKELAITLLVLTLSTWLIFGHFRWAKSSGGLFRMIWRAKLFDNRKLNPDHVVTCMLESNFIGIVFSRSIHYQFYVWYVHSLPFLTTRAWKQPVLPLLVIVVIEICYNIFPATPTSSLVLQAVHYALMLGLFFAPATKAFAMSEPLNDEKTVTKKKL